jgi:hypothetical protein
MVSVNMIPREQRQRDAEPLLGRVSQKSVAAGHWWLTPVILAIQEAEIRRITVRS